MAQNDRLSGPGSLQTYAEWMVDGLNPHQALEFYSTCSPEEQRRIRPLVKKRILRAPQPAEWSENELRRLKRDLGISSLSTPGPLR